MFNNCYKNKTVLITGNTGFKGSWLTVWLLELGAKVVGLSNAVPTKPSMFEVLHLNDKIEHHFIDVADSKATTELLHAVQPHFVFHLAAQPIVIQSYNAPEETFRTNVMGTVNVLDALRTYNQPCTAVFITSDKCYENVEWPWGYRENDRLGGKDPYSASKACAELVIYSYFHSFFSKPGCQIKLASTRAGNVIGGADWAPNRIVPDTVRAWATGEPVVIRRPNATRPWQHVMEPLSGYLALGQSLNESDKVNGQAFNFGPAANQVFTVHQVLTELAKHWTFTGEGTPIVVHDDQHLHEAGLLKLSCDKALNKLAWSPSLSFAEAIRLTSDWYYQFYNSGDSNLYDLTVTQLSAYTETAKQNGLSWTQ